MATTTKSDGKSKSKVPVDASAVDAKKHAAFRKVLNGHLRSMRKTARKIESAALNSGRYAYIQSDVRAILGHVEVTVASLKATLVSPARKSEPVEDVFASASGEPAGGGSTSDDGDDD